MFRALAKRQCALYVICLCLTGAFYGTILKQFLMDPAENPWTPGNQKTSFPASLGNGVARNTLEQTRNRTKRNNPNVDQSLIVVINEIFFYDKSFFVEMKKCGGSVKRHRKDTSALKDFQILIIDTSEPLRITLTAYLGQRVFEFQPEKTFWTFGKNLPNLHFTDRANNDAVQAEPTPSTFGFELRTSYIFLLQRSTNMQSLQLSNLEERNGNWVGKNLESGSNLIKSIVDTTVDLAIACSVQPCKPLSEAAQSFLELLKTKNGGSPITAKAVAAMKKYSLNLCSPHQPFQYSTFFHGSPTPNSENDCRGFKVQQADCDLVDFQTLSKEDAVATFERTLQCEVSKRPSQGDDLHAQEVSLMKTGWSQVFGKLEWKQNSPETIHRCKKYFSSDGKILRDTSTAAWLKLEPDGPTCKMHCSACQLFTALKLRPDFHRLPALATSEGTAALTEPRRNDENLKRHQEGHMHRLAIILMKALAGEDSMEKRLEIAELFEEKVYNFYRPTMRVVALSYAELKAGISFKSHGQLVQAIGIADTEVGLLHRNPRTTVMVAEVLSNQFRKEMLQLFVELDSPFTIIIDSSTDVSNSALVAAILQIHDSHSMRTFFYGLLHVKRENAEQMSRVITDQVELDNSVVSGFENMFRSKLAAVVTDNANVMVGARKSVFVMLQQYTKRSILLQPCYNHKLQIVFKKALKMTSLDDEEITYLDAYTYFQSLYKMNNKFFVFFNSRGSKRYGALQSVCVETGVVCHRFKSYLDIRWAASHFEVSRAVMTNLLPTVDALSRLKSDPDETAKTRTKIHELEAILKDTFYVLALHEQLDILSVFKKASLLFQQKNIPMIEFYAVIEITIDSLLSLKAETGSYLQAFLNDCTCENVCGKNECNLNNADACSSLKWNGLSLKSSIFKLASVKPIVIDGLVLNLYTEFPIPLLRCFKVLDISTYTFDTTTTPPTIMKPAKFTSDFAAVCVFLGYSSHQIQLLTGKYWEFVKQNSESLKNHRVKGVSNSLSSTLHILDDATLKEFFLKLLSIPIGSSEAERAFSYMSMYKSQYRSSMSTGVLNNIITVKMNGPPIDKSNLYNFTKLFLEKHKRVDSIYSLKGKTSSVEFEDDANIDFDSVTYDVQEAEEDDVFE